MSGEDKARCRFEVRRGLEAKVYDLARLGKVVSVFGKYGFGVLLSRIGLSSGLSGASLDSMGQELDVTAVRFREALVELGVSAVKLGQMLSTRSDVLPDGFTVALSELHDHAEELSFSEIDGILKQSYGGDYSSVFSEIEEKCLGSASIAQVHRGRLKDGRRVVLKVQRSGLRELLRSDIELMLFIARLLEKHVKEIAYFRPVSLVEQFRESMKEELDFDLEGYWLEYFGQRYGEGLGIRIPQYYREFSRSNVLVMEELSGRKLSEVSGSDFALMGVDSVEVVRRILDVAFRMIFEDGVFHADPHPGNMLIDERGQIVLLDFGSVGKFSKRERSLMRSVLMGIYWGHGGLIARSLVQLGHCRQRVNLRALEVKIGAILDKTLKSSLGNLDVQAFVESFISAGREFQIEVPSSFMKSIRAVVYLESAVRGLDPGLSLEKLVEEYSQELLYKSFNGQQLKVEFMQRFLGAVSFWDDFPSWLMQMMEDAYSGDIRISVHRKVVEGLESKLVMVGVMLSVSILLGVVLISASLWGDSMLFRSSLGAMFLWILALVWIFVRRKVG